MQFFCSIVILDQSFKQKKSPLSNFCLSSFLSLKSSMTVSSGSFGSCMFGGWGHHGLNVFWLIPQKVNQILICGIWTPPWALCPLSHSWAVLWCGRVHCTDGVGQCYSHHLLVVFMGWLMAAYMGCRQNKRMSLAIFWHLIKLNNSLINGKIMINILINDENS